MDAVALSNSSTPSTHLEYTRVEVYIRVYTSSYTPTYRRYQIHTHVHDGTFALSNRSTPSTHLCVCVCVCVWCRDGVPTIRRLLKIIGLFCRISSLLQGSFAKETFNLKESTNRSHPMCFTVYMCYCICMYLVVLCIRRYPVVLMYINTLSWLWMPLHCQITALCWRICKTCVL